MTSTIASCNTNKTIRVVAPATLEEDFTFDVTLPGENGERRFSVTVPPGGVKEGEEFEIPYPSSDDDDDDDDDDEYSEEKHTLPCRSSSLEQLDTESESTTGAPYGRWRNHLCACCDVITQATFWMAIFCPPVLIAQLVTRLRLNYKGKRIENPANSAQTTFGETHDESSLSFNKIVLSFVAILVVANMLPLIGFALVGLYVVIVMVFVGSNLRYSMRQRYKIPTALKCFGNNGCVEDCVCMLFCGCCSIIQMSRHTHNDKEYPGSCFSTTGLESGAPSIV
jgi:Cys-rich protein (TIGR01571 family)